MAGGVEYQVTKVDPTNPETKGMVYQVNSVSEEVAATLGGKVYRARIINNPTEPTVAGKVYQIVLIGDPDDPAVKGKVYNAILTGDSEVVVVGPGVSPLDLPDAIASSLHYVKAFGGTEQRNLPDGYTQLEYIESSGTQYIDTSVYISTGYKVRVKAYATSIPTSMAFFGCTTTADASNARKGIYRIIGGTINRCAWGDGSGSVIGNLSGNDSLNTWYDMVCDNGVWTINDTLFATCPESSFTSEYSMWLFARNTGGTVGLPASCRISVCQIWDNNGQMIRNLVPAKNASNVVGMYDLVNGVFYQNAGTGDFVAGDAAVPTPDTPMDIVSNNGVLKARHQSGLPWGYTLLDYIESTGTQYIDTGINLTSDYNIEIKFNGKGQEAFIFGGRTSSTLKSYGLYLNNVANVQPNFSFAQTPQAVANYSWLDTILKYQDKSLYWNGSSVVTYTEIFSCDYPSYLFAMNNAGTAHEKKFTGKIYYTKIWNNGTLVRDFIPAKDSNNVVGLYDTVSGTFFTNAGTGTFTAGNPVSDPVEVYADGTVETINVHSKNLFNKATISKYTLLNTSTGETMPQEDEWSWCSDFIPVSSSTTYYFKSGANWPVRIFEYAGDKSYLSRNYTARDSSFAVGSTCKFIRFHIGNNAGGQAMYEGETMISLGSTATEYEPYFNGGTATAEMLLKAGTYQDVQSILDGEVTRSVGVKVLDGTENWFVVTGYSNLYGLAVADGVFESNKLPMSTHYQGTTANNASMSNNTVKATTATVLAPNKVSVYIKDGVNDTLENFKQFLANQYAAGTPVIVVYPLAESTTESVTGQTLQVQEGNNILEITQASMSGLELEAEYEKEGA